MSYLNLIIYCKAKNPNLISKPALGGVHLKP